jgi:hypothetical protein
MNNQCAAHCGSRWNLQLASSASQAMIECGKLDE